MPHTVDFFFLVILVFDCGKIHRSIVGENHPSGFEVLITSEKDGIKHRFIKKEVSHPL